MFQTIKKIAVACLVLAGALSATSCARTQGWSNVQPAYNARQNALTVRVEGGTDITDKLNCYAFLDADTAEKNSADLENFYGEARVAYALNDVFRVAVEYDCGNNCKDLARVGLTITPKTGKRNFTMLKFWPVETSGQKGPQVCIYSSQKLTDKLSASMTAEYNIDSRTLYLEPELRFKPNDQFFAFLQGRGFGSIDDKIEFAPVIGVGYNF